MSCICYFPWYYLKCYLMPHIFCCLRWHSKEKAMSQKRRLPCRFCKWRKVPRWTTYPRFLTFVGFGVVWTQTGRMITILTPFTLQQRLQKTFTSDIKAVTDHLFPLKMTNVTSFSCENSTCTLLFKILNSKRLFPPQRNYYFYSGTMY